MEDKKEEKTRLGQFLWDRGLSLKDAERITGVCYPTLENLKLGKKVNYRARTLRDVAAFCKCTVDELLGVDPVGIKYNTAFDRAVAALAKKHNADITLKYIHDATGISLPVLGKFKKGGRVNCTDRTVRYLAEFLEISEDELRNNEVIDGDLDLDNEGR